jgi:hypothetical protein
VYGAFLLAAVSGALGTTGGFLINLPITLRCIDFGATFYAAELALSLDWPIKPAIFTFYRLGHVIRAETIVPLIAVAAWLLAGYLATIVRYVVPPQLPRPTDQELAQRLEDEKWERDIKTRHLAECAPQLARRRSFDVMMLLFGVLLGAVIFGKDGAVPADLVLSLAGAAVIGGLLLYLALVELSARQRLVEIEKLAAVPSSSGVARIQGAVIPALVAVAFGCLMPANISPFLYINFNPWLSHLGALWFRTIRKPIGGVLAPSTGPIEQIHPIGMADQSFFMQIVVNIVTVVLIGTFIYCIWLFLHGEKEKARNFPRLLLALLLWPWRLFLGWLNRKVLKRNSTMELTHSDESAKSASEATNKHQRLRANDAAMLVRLTFSRLLKAAANDGVPRFRHETASEYVNRLALVVPDAGTPAQDITDVYCVTRYAGCRPPDGIRSTIILNLRQAVNALRRYRLSRFR